VIVFRRKRKMRELSIRERKLPKTKNKVFLPCGVLPTPALRTVHGRPMPPARSEMACSMPEARTVTAPRAERRVVTTRFIVLTPPANC
jgi:hypothetical protein